MAGPSPLLLCAMLLQHAGIMPAVQPAAEAITTPYSWSTLAVPPLLLLPAGTASVLIEH